MLRHGSVDFSQLRAIARRRRPGAAPGCQNGANDATTGMVEARLASRAAKVPGGTTAMSVFDLLDVDAELANDHAQFAEFEAGRLPDMPLGVAERAIARVAVVGAGTTGGGITMALVNAGIATTLIEADAAGIERGLKRIRDNYEHGVKRGRIGPEQVSKRMALIRSGVRLEDAADADLVIEAVHEDLALKRDIFRRLDGIARPGAILTSNTSGLDIDAIAAATKRPADVIGTHFFGPAQAMRLLEVVRGARTADDVIATLMALGPRLGKIAVLARAHPGFVGNALFRAYNREAFLLIEDGALPHEVDAALTGFGFAMGLFVVHDMAGNDVGHAARKAQLATRDANRRWGDLIVKLVEMGRLGHKSGKGWYRYEPGDRKPHRDPELEAFVVAESARLGIQRRPISRHEILERCLYCMVNEGARLLEQGIAMRPSDIDVVWLAGYGFPPAQGGPMFMADRIGLSVVAAAVQRLHAELGAWWEPAPLLMQLAEAGRTFAQWQAERTRPA
jgi:3-hydroxyacyl-CoA dehydrogenase